MEIEYQPRKLGKQMGFAVECQKAFGQMAKKVRIRIMEIQASPNLEVLMQIPAAECHPLTGNRAGDWAVSISGNFRIVFNLGPGPLPRNEVDNEKIDYTKVDKIFITGVEDYHHG